MTDAVPVRGTASSGVRLSAKTVRRLLLVLIVVAWELLPRLGLAPKVILAPLSSTLMAGVQQPGMFASALLITMRDTFFALCIAYIGGGAVGLLLSSVRSLRLTMLPIVASVYAVPFIVIYPVLTAWMGIGSISQIWFAGVYGFFPMVLAVAAGGDFVSVNHTLAARSMGATRMQLLVHIVIPSMIPAIVSGLRLAGALVAIGVVAAEMLTSTGGIGFLITQNRTMFRTPEVYCGILLVLVLAGLLDRLLSAFEQRHLRRTKNRV